ncbi:Asp/Glu/hydantoin racemase [Klebsiella variicola]|nr:Asp/Glu/hydantoin racemase [Klebsiella variicola]
MINPNTSLAMTETIGAAARAVAAPGTEILAVCPRAGVPSIEGHFDEAIAAVGVLEQIKAGREQGVDGHVIACFGDPGLLAARELAQGPVIGIAEAAMHMATMVATRFLHCDHAAAHADHRPSFAATSTDFINIARRCTPLICRCWRWKTAAAWRRRKCVSAAFAR